MVVELCELICESLLYNVQSYQLVLTSTGSNRYCLDKNYAGVLIIWDRLFGTFEKFRPEEKITYGLVGQPQFFNPLRHQVRPFCSIHLIWKLASPTQMKYLFQLFYMKSVFEKACSMDNFSDKVSSFLKGPGWFPGTGRLGDLQMVPEVIFLPGKQFYNIFQFSQQWVGIISFGWFFIYIDLKYIRMLDIWYWYINLKYCWYIRKWIWIL